MQNLLLHHGHARAFESVPDYILCVRNDDYRVALTRLRVLSNWLSIIRGAQSYMHREQRVCPLSKNGIGDKFRFLFQCGKLHVLRALHFWC